MRLGPLLTCADQQMLYHETHSDTENVKLQCLGIFPEEFQREQLVLRTLPKHDALRESISS